MSLTTIATLPIGGCIPAAVEASIAGAAGINLALPDILARLEALLAFSPQPISFSASLTLAQQIVASIQANIALGLPVPDLSAQIAIVAALIAALEAAVEAINANLQIVLGFQALLSAGAVTILAYDGPTNAMGGEITTALASGLPGGSAGAHANAIILATIDATTWASMQLVFKTS